jgi:hypothetical protein
MLFSHLHKYKYKYFIAILLAIQIGLILFVAFKSTNVIDTFTPLQPKTLSDGEEHFYPCDNFCGPKGECAINREQCVANSECSGCIKPYFNPDTDVPGNNTSFLEGFSNASTSTSQGLPMYKSPETSSLTTDITNFATVIEKNAKVPKMNKGVDLWTKTFNYGLKMEKSKTNNDFMMYPDELEYQPKYKTTETVTGMFTDIGPTAANANL